MAAEPPKKEEGGKQPSSESRPLTSPEQRLLPLTLGEKLQSIFSKHIDNPTGVIFPPDVIKHIREYVLAETTMMVNIVDTNKDMTITILELPRKKITKTITLSFEHQLNTNWGKRHALVLNPPLVVAFFKEFQTVNDVVAVLDLRAVQPRFIPLWSQGARRTLLSGTPSYIDEGMEHPVKYEVGRECILTWVTFGSVFDHEQNEIVAVRDCYLFFYQEEVSTVPLPEGITIPLKRWRCRKFTSTEMPMQYTLCRTSNQFFNVARISTTKWVLKCNRVSDGNNIWTVDIYSFYNEEPLKKYRTESDPDQMFPMLVSVEICVAEHGNLVLACKHNQKVDIIAIALDRLYMASGSPVINFAQVSQMPLPSKCHVDKNGIMLLGTYDGSVLCIDGKCYDISNSLDNSSSLPPEVITLGRNPNNTTYSLSSNRLYLNCNQTGLDDIRWCELSFSFKDAPQKKESPSRPKVSIPKKKKSVYTPGSGRFYSLTTFKRKYVSEPGIFPLEERGYIHPGIQQRYFIALNEYTGVKYELASASPMETRQPEFMSITLHLPDLSTRKDLSNTLLWIGAWLKGETMKTAQLMFTPVVSIATYAKVALLPYLAHNPDYEPGFDASFCDYCHAQIGYYVCGRCETAIYCSHEHQEAHWNKQHKKDCENFRRAYMKVRHPENAENV
jgi:hypothetical protein